jgi:hypothetical protein
MKIKKTMYAVVSIMLLLSCASTNNPSAPSPENTQMVRDDWPRQIVEGAVTFTISQPQVETWEGNKLTARTAVGVQAQGDQKQRYGAVWFTARTEVNKDTRMVLLQDFAITKINFKGVPDNGQSYRTALSTTLPNHPVQIALDRLQASFEVSGSAGKGNSVQVKNTPPRIIFTTKLSVLVLVDGKPVLREIKGSELRQVINTGVMMVAEKSGGPFYLWLSDCWVQAPSLDGPWSAAAGHTAELATVKKDLAAGKKVDLLENISPDIKKSMQGGQLPDLYVSTVPARLIQTKGAPDLEDIPGTALRYAANSNDIIIFDMTGLRYYVLIDGRWYQTISRENGPWTYTAGTDLPPDFARIPPWNPAGRALYAVPGTPQAKQAVVEATTPHTQTISKSANALVTYDGQPQFSPISGTTLRYAVNSSLPVIRIDDKNYYTVQSGVWFYSTTPTGPWTVATSVPPVMYTIPASSPMHCVTYVYVYGTTPTAVYTGYTPGYYGEVISPYNTVVYSTGYVYPGWAGAYWYPPPNYYYYNDDYYQVQQTYDGKYVDRYHSDYANYTKVGDTTFAHTQDGTYATKNGNLYQREVGGWKEYNPSTGDWELSNFSKAVDTKRIHDHRTGQPTDLEQHRENTGRGSSAGTSGTGDTTASSGDQSRFGNRDGGDTQRELNDSFQSRNDGEQRFSDFSRGSWGGSDGGRFGGGEGFGGGGFGGFGGGFGGGRFGGGRR